MGTEPVILPSEQENPTGLIRKYFSAVDELTRLALTTHTPEGLLESSVDLIKDLLSVEKASVMLLDLVTENLPDVVRAFMEILKEDMLDVYSGNEDHK